jgi:hypothetical protein
VLLYASNERLEGWGSLDVGGPVELLKWRSASTLEAAPMWVSPTHYKIQIRVFSDRLSGVMDEISYPDQHGFRRGLGIQTALLPVLEAV